MMTRTLQVVAGTYVNLVTNNENPKIFKIEGYVNGTTNIQYFIQIHNLPFASLVSGSSIPLRSLQVLGLDGFTFNFQPTGLTLANLPGIPASGSQPSWCVVLSTTDAVYTAPTSQTVDINVDMEEYEIEPSTTTSVTNNATSYAIIVADAVSLPSNRLILLTVSAASAPAYVQLFAKIPTVGAVPILQLEIPSVNPPTQLLPTLTTVIFNFTYNGRAFYQQDANGKAHGGIYAAVSATSNAYDGTLTANFTGVYR